MEVFYHLCAKGRIDEARSILENIYPADAVSDELQALKISVDEEKELEGSLGGGSLISKVRQAWGYIVFRRGLRAGITVQVAQQFVGINTVMYYNPTIIQFAENGTSNCNCSLKTSDSIAEARTQVLNYFNASPRDYSVIFTSGATAALKLVGETFPWSSQSCFMYTMENHNSVLGIREYALDKGATSIAVDIQDTADHSESISSKSAIRIIQHNEQRRVEGGLSKEDLSNHP